MNEPEATVVERRGRFAVVRAVPVVCARCRSGHGCGAGLALGNDRPRELLVELAPGLDARPGDSVVLATAGGTLVRRTLIAYGLPLGGLLAAASLAGAAGLPDLAAAAAALLGLSGGAVVGRFAGRRDGSSAGIAPIAVPPGATVASTCQRV